MHTHLLKILLGCLLALRSLEGADLIRDEAQAEEFMKELDGRYGVECNLEMLARWDYITDVEDPDKETAANEAAVRYLGFKGEAAKNASLYDYEGFEDDELYRRFRFLSKQGPGALNQTDLTEYKELQAGMETIYSTATICDYHNDTDCDLTLEPDIEEILATSTDYDELAYVWEEWREKTGKLMRDDFNRFVELSNKAAELDGFEDTGSYWLNPYTVTLREADAYEEAFPLDQEAFREMVDVVWEKVSNDLYKKLHAYVRMRLNEVYPGKINPTGPIPAHILGNMWAQDWSNIAKHVMPFPEMPSFDVTESMVENGWDIRQMFDSAEDFFTSVDLFNMTETFWEKSVIDQTEWGKAIVCHASAEDFCLGPENEDFRIKMCTEVNMVDLVTVHHEMGHIEYFMAYKNLPHVFRESANPGFHEAIGDLIALSVSTPDHLENVLGLTPIRSLESHLTSKDERYTDDEKRDLNFLMKMALEKIAFLPFGYLIDKYRWSVFDGSISPEDLNAGWWALREDLQGVTPPGGARGEEYFDPGAKYHVPANVPYIRYFVSFIVQFQFHQNLCDVIGHSGDLHTCDIYNNTDAGEVLRNALERGFSEPWPVVLQELGGSAHMDPQAIINYFDPLIKYLDQELEEAGECIGWGDDCKDSSLSTEMTTDSKDSSLSTETTTDSKDSSLSTETTTEVMVTTPDPNDEEAAQMAIDDMNEQMTVALREATYIDWEYYTDQTQEHEDASNEAALRVSTLYKKLHGEVIEYYNYETFNNTMLRRQFELQQTLGTAKLNEEDFAELSALVSGMTNTFNSVVCPFDNQGCDKDSDGISSDDLEVVMATVRDFDALKYYWEEWREVSGKPIKENYTKYIDLQNKAAEINGFEDAGLMWLEPYTSDDYDHTKFKTEIEELWNQTKGLYEKLHAYVLYKLKDTYDEIGDDADLIPAHVLGNMWAQSWENIYDLVKPYDVEIPNLDDILAENIAKEEEMFAISEEFFTSIGLYNMTDDFWENSMFRKLEGTNPICHASAWDFFDTVTPKINGSFRIKMCTNKNQEDFVVIHHEMGHTQYQMSYSELPLVFRDGANPGFHEAIGDTIALSVTTPNHLKLITERLNGTASTTTDVATETTASMEPSTPTQEPPVSSSTEKATESTPQATTSTVKATESSSVTTASTETTVTTASTVTATESSSSSVSTSSTKKATESSSSSVTTTSTEKATETTVTTTSPAKATESSSVSSTATSSPSTAPTQSTTTTSTSTSPPTTTSTGGVPPDPQKESATETSTETSTETETETETTTTGLTEEVTSEVSTTPAASYSEEDINFLMKTALAKVAFLPFAYILDQFRWEAFANKNSDPAFNRLWWEKRINVQGLAPPVPRYPESDFDVGCKYHVPTSVPYIRYFVAHILQFQFHGRLCDIAGFEGNIYNCDIYNITDAGGALRSLLEKGASEPWQQQLGDFMDSDGKMDAGALLSYFKPLEEFLDGFIEENKIEIGWRKDQVDDFLHSERAEIPATVPIVVGSVLAVMVLVVIVAYFVGRSRQKKKAKRKANAPQQTPGENIELGENRTEL